MKRINYKMISVICAFLLILTIESSLVNSIINKPQININLDLRGKLSTTLIAEAYNPDGTLKQRVIKDNDLIVNNYRNFLIAWMFSSYTSGSQTMTLYDNTNTSQTLKIKDTSTGFTNYIYDGSTGSDNKGGYMAIGTGTTSPTVLDYNVQTLYGSISAITSGYPTWTTGTGDVTLTSTIAITSSVSISEGCVYVRWLPSTGTTTKYFLLTRDTFTGIPVVNGDTFVITVKLNFSSEFTDNMGTLWTGILKTHSDGGVTSVSLTDESGSANTIRCYTTADIAYSICKYIGSDTGGSSYLQIGQSNSALSRASTALVAPIATAKNAFVPTPYISSNNIILIADITVTSDVTIREYGFFMEMSTSDGDANLLFRGLVSPSVTLTSGESVRVALTVTL